MMTIPVHNPYYWDLPIVLMIVSLIYSATRHEDWRSIFVETLRWILRLVTFLGGIGVVLYLLMWW